MISVKSTADLAKMRASGKIAGGALKLVGEKIKPGMTTLQVNKIVHDYIVSHGAKPSFLHYGGFPASACISVNEEVIHGIPTAKRVLKEGDIVSVDVGALKDGFHSDTCMTFPVGEISEEARKLLEVTQNSLFAAIDIVKAGVRIGDISHTVQEYCESRGYGVVRQYCGHGVGRQLHEDPEVPNYGVAGHGTRLVSGMTIAIEPMINVSGAGVKVLDNGWTVVTNSGSLSAHFEHTVAVTSEGAVILTLP